jgi:hypothetical protein
LGLLIVSPDHPVDANCYAEGVPIAVFRHFRFARSAYGSFLQDE